MQQDECFGPKLGLEVLAIKKSNLKTSLYQIWVICHLLPFVRVGQRVARRFYEMYIVWMPSCQRGLQCAELRRFPACINCACVTWSLTFTAREVDAKSANLALSSCSGHGETM